MEGNMGRSGLGAPLPPPAVCGRAVGVDMAPVVAVSTGHGVVAHPPLPRRFPVTWLRCLIGWHEWITYLDGSNPDHVAWGYTFRVCDRCASSRWAPGVFSDAF